MQPENMSKNLEFLMNLPSEIITDILSRLPIQTIVSCKCICRKLLELISRVPFAELHLSRSTPGLIVHQVDNNQYSCKIFEFVDKLELQHHDLHYKKLMEFDPRAFINSPKYDIWMGGCSVNGLLCLQETSRHHDAMYICNPITRDYIALPRLRETVEYPNMVTYGIGVSSSSGQCKLVRISHGPATSGPSLTSIPDFECMIYTLGTGSWRSISPGAPFEIGYPGWMFLNGNLHWMAGDAEGSSFISCLDLETEQFKPFPLHPFPSFFPIKGSLVALGDSLCFCDCCSDEEIVMWVMKEYGVGESWTKEYVISKEIGDGTLGGLSYESVYPMKAFKDGNFLFFWQDCCLFYYSSKTETVPEVDLFYVDLPGYVMPTLHTPSLLSLKSFAGENVSSF